MNNYILDSTGEPIIEPDLMKFSAWIETADRHLGRDEIGCVVISTVFLGVDHNFMPGGVPILWETMIFGGQNDGYCERANSRREALANHMEAINMVKASLLSN